MSESIRELRSLRDEEVIRLHDQRAVRTEVGTNHYLAELQRRDQQRGNDVMLAYTRQIRIMTIIMMIATLISTILVAISLFRR
jgi:hypothetical protein